MQLLLGMRVFSVYNIYALGVVYVYDALFECDVCATSLPIVYVSVSV